MASNPVSMWCRSCGRASFLFSELFFSSKKPLKSYPHSESNPQPRCQWSRHRKHHSRFPALRRTCPPIFPFLPILDFEGIERSRYPLFLCSSVPLFPCSGRGNLAGVSRHSRDSLANLGRNRWNHWGLTSCETDTSACLVCRFSDALTMSQSPDKECYRPRSDISIQLQKDSRGLTTLSRQSREGLL